MTQMSRTSTARDLRTEEIAGTVVIAVIAVVAEEGGREADVAGAAGGMAAADGMAVVTAGADIELLSRELNTDLPD